MIFFGGLLSSFFALFNFVRLTVVPPLDLVLLERGGSSSFGDSSSAFGCSLQKRTRTVIFNSLCRLIAAACVNFIEFLLFFVVPYTIHPIIRMTVIVLIAIIGGLFLRVDVFVDEFLCSPLI
eukprot:247081_1